MSSSNSQGLSSIIATVTTASVLTAGALYCFYKFVWNDDDFEDFDEEPHWSDKPKRPRPEFSETTSDTATIETPQQAKPMKTPRQVRQSLANQVLSDANIEDILKWFDSIVINPDAGIDFSLLADKLVEREDFAQILLQDHNPGPLDPESITRESIYEALLSIITLTQKVVTRDELCTFLHRRKTIHANRQSFLRRITLSPFNFRRYIYNVD